MLDNNKLNTNSITMVVNNMKNMKKLLINSNNF
jgi:hypothetical protein